MPKVTAGEIEVGDTIQINGNMHLVEFVRKMGDEVFTRAEDGKTFHTSESQEFIVVKGGKKKKGDD